MSITKHSSDSTTEVWVTYFGAEWCRACAEKRPLVEQTCKELAVSCVHGDIDNPEDKAQALALGFRTIPAVVVWQGQPLGAAVSLYRAHGGLINRPALENAITRAREAVDGEG